MRGIRSRKNNLGAQPHVKPATRKKPRETGSRCNFTQRTLSYSAVTRRARRQGSRCVDGDGLESAEVRAFRRLIEAGGSPSREER